MSNHTTALTVADLYPARLRRLRTASARVGGWSSGHEAELLELLLLTAPRLRTMLQHVLHPSGARVPACSVEPTTEEGAADVAVLEVTEVRAYNRAGRPSGYTEEVTETLMDFADLEAELLDAPTALVVSLDALAGASVHLPVD